MLLPVEGEQDSLVELTAKIQVRVFFLVFFFLSNLESICCRQTHLHVTGANTKILYYMYIIRDKIRILLLLKNNQSFQ